MDRFFSENLSAVIYVSAILGFVGHFVVSFCVSGTSFDVFGVLGGSGVPKATCSATLLEDFGLHFGIIFGAKMREFEGYLFD